MSFLTSLFGSNNNADTTEQVQTQQDYFMGQEQDYFMELEDHTPEEMMYDYNEQELVEKLEQANQDYRMGESELSDDEYDSYVDSLATINPDNPFLHSVEPETLGDTTFAHETPMLSTNKAYDCDSINAWLDKIVEASIDCNEANPIIRATAKLDGVACKFLPEPLTLATRGDGVKGNVCTHLLQKGLVIVGNADREAVGEIVMKTQYFKDNLADNYSHPRSFVAGVVNADTHKQEAITALANGAIELVLYKDMPAIEMPLSDFRAEHEAIEETLRNCEYPIDGVVFEVTSEPIKAYMGANSHHHHWQIAKKIRGNEQQTVVTDIVYSTGRSGRITPTVIFDAIDLDGANTTKATGHHVGNIISKGIGIGATIKVLKAGEIIPFISQVVTPCQNVNIPNACPQCGGSVEMREDQLYCISDDCGGRSESSIIHHFSTIDALLFGKVTVSKLVSNGFDTIESIYAMTHQDFVSCGLGDGQAQNLLNEIERVKSQPLDDFKLLASLGISKLGRGSAKKLLAVYRIQEAANVRKDQLSVIDGFGDVSAETVTQKLHQNATLAYLLEQGFNLVHTQDKSIAPTATNNPLSGKKVVFTGKCTLSRNDMNDYAQSLGCVAQERVGKDTDYLVCGDNVGATKMESARKKGVTVLTENEFRELYQNGGIEQEVTTDNANIEAVEPLAISNTELTCAVETKHNEAKIMTTATTEHLSNDTGTLLQLDPTTLKTPEWGNPRTHIADSDYNNLLQSILARKSRGIDPIHTPIFVRPVSGGYEIVAGFTRTRAAIEAQLATMPCLCRSMSDQEAYELAVSENVDRTSMSALDEAQSLKEIVKLHHGDIQAAATEMGWSRPKFDRALQLLRASDKVRGLVGVKQDNGFTLSVTHAARLSTLPENLQDKIVESVINEKMPVSVLQEKINKAVKRPLQCALFDQSECQQCPYNSQSLGQTSMFAEDNEQAECTNPSCYVKKTDEHYQARLTELEQDYGKIVLLSTVEQPRMVNPSVVGIDQYNNGCLSCANHCAILADKGTKLGAILENCCLDATCAQEKMQAFKEQSQVQSQAPVQATQSVNQAVTGAPSIKPATTKASTAKPSAKSETPKRLVLESQTALRKVGEQLLINHPSYALAVTLSSLKAQTEMGHSIESGIIKYMSHTPDELQQMILDTINKLTVEVQKESLNMERTIIKAAQKHCGDFEDKAVGTWTPTTERLTAMTKTIRQQVMEQSGFANAYKNAHSESKYAALINKKTDEAVNEILAFGFDWSNYAPDYYRKAMTEQKYNY